MCILRRGITASSSRSRRQTRHPRVHPVPEARVCRLQEAFALADTDGSGELSVDEFSASLSTAMAGLGQPEQDKLNEYLAVIKEKFSQFDTDGSGGLSQNEWGLMSAAGQRAAQVSRQHQQLKGVFEAADTDKDLALSTSEMFEGFNQYGYDEKQIDMFFKMGDNDQNGLLTFDEFIAGRDAMQRAKEVDAMAESFQSEEDQIKAFVDADINRDGKLSLLEYTGAMEEFLKALGGDAGTIGANDITESFKRFDEDVDGKVTQQEWLAAVKRDSAKKTEL